MRCRTQNRSSHRSLGWLTALAALGLVGNVVHVDAAKSPRAPGTIGLRFGPDTTVVSEPLDRHGYPDYLAAVEQRLGADVARDENFWVLMWPAIGNAERSKEEFISTIERRLGVTISREPRFSYPTDFAGLKQSSPEAERLNDQWSASMERPWTRAEFPLLAKWVDAHEAQLAEVHAACQRPKAFAPLYSGEGNFPLIAVLLPHVQALRSVARVQLSRAMLRLGEGDVDGSWQDLLDLHRVAGHSERGWTLIEALVGYAIRAMGQKPLAQWVSQCDLPAEELAARWAELEPLLQIRPLTTAIDSERFMYLDVVLTILSGKASAREVTQLVEPVVKPTDHDDGTAESLAQVRTAREMLFQLMVLGIDVNETLRYGNRMYDDLVAAVAPATHGERTRLLEKIEARTKADAAATRGVGALASAYFFSSSKDLQTLPAKALTALLIPAVAQVERAYTRAAAYLPLTRAAFAVRAALDRNGELPASLEAIEGLAAGDIVDPFSGAPLKTLTDPRGVVIYSVGINGEDDGGQGYDDGSRPDGTRRDDLRIILSIAP